MNNKIAAMIKEDIHVAWNKKSKLSSHQPPLGVPLMMSEGSYFAERGRNALAAA